ncbi:hypothetical protein BHM03_00011431 [Ensete ventricosum]|nr:hypothetical protein BHM03_00011431 [Ensete ventricosum]
MASRAMVVASFGRWPGLFIWPAINRSVVIRTGPPRFVRFASPSAKPSKLVAASMENPPPGYRRNVGICLVNPESKVWHLLSLGTEFRDLFVASRILVMDRWTLSDLFGFEARHPRRVANASGARSNHALMVLFIVDRCCRCAKNRILIC